jgi:hypothetical protein
VRQIDQDGVKVGAQELACAEKWLHQDHFVDLLAQIGLTVQKQDC